MFIATKIPTKKFNGLLICVLKKGENLPDSARSFLDFARKLGWLSMLAFGLADAKAAIAAYVRRASV